MYLAIVIPDPDGEFLSYSLMKQFLEDNAGVNPPKQLLEVVVRRQIAN